MNKDKRKNLTLSVVALSVGIALFLLSGSGATAVTETTIARNNPGNGSKDLRLGATVDDIYIDEIAVSVEERDYTIDECKKLFEECREDLIRTILSDNRDLNEVTQDLWFTEEIRGYPFSFEYETDVPDKIDSSGEILSDIPFSAIVRITGTYEDFSDSYSVKLKVTPGEEVKKRVYKRKILLLIGENEKEEEVTLPTDLDGAKIRYQTEGKKREPGYLLFGAVAAAAVLLGGARDERAKREAYKKAMLKEYPTAVKKISLYLASGMNLRNIWQAVYEEGVRKKGKDNPFYKEMGIALNELSGGISEGLAYTRFGERTKQPELIRFTALLSQNLKKGSSRLKELLNEEVTKAFMEKKQRAIKEGEEAGTKMLIPMVLLLIDVMIIIVIPAFRGI